MFPSSWNSRKCNYWLDFHTHMMDNYCPVLIDVYQTLCSRLHVCGYVRLFTPLHNNMELSIPFFFQMVSLYTDPNGEKLFDKAIPTASNNSNRDTHNFQLQRSAGDLTGEYPENVASLKARIKDLESQLAVKNTMVMLFCFAFVNIQ